MRQLVVDILMKMARMDVAAKELTAQVEAQSLLVAALLINANQNKENSIARNVQHAIVTASQSSSELMQTDADLLLTHVNRLLMVTSYVEKQAEES